MIARKRAAPSVVRRRSALRGANPLCTARSGSVQRDSSPQIKSLCGRPPQGRAQKRQIWPAGAVRLLQMTSGMLTEPAVNGRAALYPFGPDRASSRINPAESVRFEIREIRKVAETK